MFAAVQVPFNSQIRKDGGRHSWIGYNFCFRRFFDLLDMSHHNVDFPPLKSKKKRQEVTSYWLRILSFTKWPYIDTDADYFGEQFRTDIRELPAKRRRTSSPKGTHAKSGDCGFRRGHPDGASEQRDVHQPVLQQASTGVLGTHTGDQRGVHSGTCDDVGDSRCDLSSFYFLGWDI